MRTAAQILAESRVIAVVGASRNPAKAAHSVPLRMHRYGWRVIPVNPHADQVFGVPAYRRLDDIAEPVDLVDVFRPAQDAPEVVRQALAMGARAIWLQSGIVSPSARRMALDAGIDYVEDRCVAVEAALAGLAGPTPPDADRHRPPYGAEPDPA